MVTVTSKEQAKQVLIDWIRAQGYTADIRFSMSYGLRSSQRGNYYDFDVLRPYGVYLVFEDGSVEDNYGTLVKKKIGTI